MSSFSRHQKGYVVVNPKHPSAAGVCDESGFVFNRKDLYKQMEWRGNNLVWTGFYKSKMYLDEPDPQNRPPPSNLNDPVPLKDSRPPVPYLAPGTNPVLPPNELNAKLNNVKWGE
jgi:hypothetical protein